MYACCHVVLCNSHDSKSRDCRSHDSKSHDSKSHVNHMTVNHMTVNHMTVDHMTACSTVPVATPLDTQCDCRVATSAVSFITVRHCMYIVPVQWNLCIVVTQ